MPLTAYLFDDRLILSGKKIQMSQHQQQPESDNIEPQTPPTPETTANGENEVAGISDMIGEEAIPSPITPSPLPLTSRGGDTYPTAKSTKKQKLGLFKIVVIKILRGTIWLLEKIVEKLEPEAVRIPTTVAQSPEAMPSAGAAIAESTIDTTIAEPEIGVAVRVSDISTPSLTVPEAIPEVAQKPRKAKQVSTLAKVGRFWRGILSTVRSLLPRKWHEKLSDLVLSSAIAGITVILILTKVALAPKTAETPTQLVTEIPSETIDTPSQSPVETSAPVETTPEETSEIVETSKNVEVSEPKKTTSEVVSEPEKTTTEAVYEPEKTTSEAVSEPVEAVAAPPVELTPEERLIASIQNQLTEITDEYSNGLIESIKANFRGSFLVVTISDGWYQLKESQQNQLGDAILNRAKDLDFSQLEIVNSSGNTIARSPVIGHHMIVFQSQ